MKRKWYGYFLLSLPVLLLLQNVVKASTVQSYLEKTNFVPINSPVADFSLQTTRMNNHSLADFKGNWIFLVFWATWCGPCRVEMPGLEGLYQELKDEGLRVIGVSIDSENSSMKKVQKFVNEHQLTFPILHDPDNNVASLYKASSVPTIYAISPDWKLVGMSKGAQDFENPRLIDNIRNLIKFKEVKDIPSPSPGPDQIALPAELEPPKITIRPPTGELATGKTINFEVTLSWVGSARQYIIKTPKLTLPETVKMGAISSITESNFQESILRYRFPLIFQKAGTYIIGPAQVSYTSRSSQKELYCRAPQLEVIIPEGFWVSNLVYILVSVAIFTLLIIAGAVYFKRRASKQESEVGIGVSDEFNELREEFKKIEIQKNNLASREYEVRLLQLYLNVLKVHTVDSNPERDKKREIEKLEIKLDQIRYGGSGLLPYEADHYTKLLKKDLRLNNEEEEVELED